MPSVIGSGKTRKIVFDAGDWLGGLNIQYSETTTTPKLDIGGKLSYAHAFNPYRHLGIASPGYGRISVNNEDALIGYLKKGVVEGGDVYATAHADEIVEISSGNVSDDATWPHTISPHGGASSPVADDCAIYTADVSGTKTRQLFYSWSDDTSWDVGTFDFSSTFDDDFMQNAPASTLGSPYTTDGQGKKHPLEVGADDILYIGDRRFIHAYDGYTGTDGTFSAEVLKIPDGMEFRSFVRMPRYLVGFAHRASSLLAGTGDYQGEAWAYFWDYFQQDPSFRFPLDDNYVGEAFTYKGTIGVFTQGRTNDLSNSGNRNSKLQLFRGFSQGFTPEFTFTANVPERGGVLVSGDMIMWNSDGEQWSYGGAFSGMDPVVNKLARAYPGVTNSPVSGLLMNPEKDYYLMSGNSGGSRLYKLEDGRYSSDCVVATNNAYPNFSEGKMGRIHAVKVFFADTATNGRSLKLEMVDQAEQSTTIFDGLIDVTSDVIVKEYREPDERPTFSSIKSLLTYGNGDGTTDAPKVERIEVYFQEENIVKV